MEMLNAYKILLCQSLISWKPKLFSCYAALIKYFYIINLCWTTNLCILLVIETQLYTSPENYPPLVCDVASKISSFELFLNKILAFTLLLIKEKFQITLCPSINECLFCRLKHDNKFYRYFKVFKCLSKCQYFNLPNI